MSSVVPLKVLAITRPASGVCGGPRPLKTTGGHGHFLNSTCDMGLSDMRQVLRIIVI